VQSAIHVATAALNVGLNLWLIPWYGPAGAALATLGSYAFVVVAPLAVRATRPTAWSALRAYGYPVRWLLHHRRPGD
jgi:O-antigen/teichoic acid export membrane protein